MTSDTSPHDAPVPEALADIRRRIAAAAARSGRDPSDITLTAVSKQQPWEAIAPVLTAGQRVFGENRVQEAKARWGALPPEQLSALELRLIGPLQSNKAREAVAFFDVIETLDRPKLAAALAEAIAKEGRTPRLLVQVNTGEEPQKAGVLPGGLEGLLALCRAELGLEVEGLMAIPPDDEDVAPHAALLAKLTARHGLAAASVGMSGDYETAVRFGATIVRVGTAIFGARPAKAARPAAA